MEKPASVSDTDGRRRLTSFLEETDLRKFIESQLESNSRIKALSFTFPVPAFDPLACLEMLPGTNQSSTFYWEKPDQELALAAGGEAGTLQSSGADRFNDIAQQIEQLKQQTGSYTAVRHSLAGIHLVGGFSFFDTIESEAWSSFGAGTLTLPEWLLVRDGKLCLLTTTIPLQPNDTPETIAGHLRDSVQKFDRLFELQIQPDGFNNNSFSQLDQDEFANTPEEQWTGIVERARELIDRQRFEKIVLAREVKRRLREPVVPTQVMNILRSQYPSCYNFMIQTSSGSVFLGSSPERLVSFHKNYLLTDSLAGSISRGKTATEDLHLERNLMNSRKNRREHQFVTNAIENHLQPFISRIERSDDPDIKKLKNVQHLHTPVRAWLKEESSRFFILSKLHPTPAVGGYPREKAVPYIRELEQFDRGWYAGPVGWFNLEGGGEFSVAIRSCLIDGNCARLYAGCGIVNDSDPHTEWEETNLKLMPILSALESNEGSSSE
ncbi:MAG: isochorismate synthase [Balneolaceae bacterium]|nr:isochorismate synthase [Balneolaceae bacterium]